MPASKRPVRTWLSKRRISPRVVADESWSWIPPTNRHSFTARYARGKGLTISFSRRMKAHHMLRAIELVDNGTVSLDGMISSTYPLSEAAKGFDELVARSGLKIVVKPTP